MAPCERAASHAWDSAGIPASLHGGGHSLRSWDKLLCPCWWQLGPHTAPQPRAGPAPVARMLVRRRPSRHPLPQPHVRTTFPPTPPAALSTGCHTRLDGLRIRQLCPGSPGAPSATSASLAPEPPGTDWVTPVEVSPKVQALGAPGVLLVQPHLHRATATHPDGAHPLGTSTRTATSITNADGRSGWHGN